MFNFQKKGFNFFSSFPASQESEEKSHKIYLYTFISVFVQVGPRRQT